jgi:GT2 family glycosyltransferase
MPNPLVSVVISNKNGVQWLPRCLESVRRQTIADRIEVIIVDNVSTDDSVPLARKLLAGFPQASVIENKQDLGFTGGMNTGAFAAKSEGVFLLSNDAWMEDDCLEKLLREIEAAKAGAAMPLVLNYEDSSLQSLGADGIDFFGLSTTNAPTERSLTQTMNVFMVAGCGFWARTDLFRKLGGFDTGQFMFAEETDLSWRVWIAGEKIIRVPAARLHHRGAAGVNPAGETKIVESRTSETKRYLANRNGILVLLKNAQHILLVLLIPHLLLLFVEALVSLVLMRRWGYVRKSYFAAIADAFRMMGHVRDWRRRIKAVRKRSDFAMLRYLRLRPGRWDEVKRLFRFGVPKVDAR